MATILYFKRIVLSSQQHAYPASRQISALRVSLLFFMPMVKVSYPKHLISFADQISLLKQRGLSFKDEAKALHLLQNISYYRLSGYWFTDTSLFSNSMRHAKILAKIDEEYQRSDEEFVTAFKSKYSDRFPPSWMTMEITSFGTLSIF